ncbi:LAFE_0H12530g1_1 [Lachancea fermentati]|uniref:nicotinamidase n=1 Tax=Lachancea fermentati TaxID=4955 RepID=A0A1G4MKH9_LACFM|nr:LAFE_0H12530g1_1 [Lachancea fermentati]
MTKALIIVDIQNDFLPPKGSLAVADGDQIVGPVAQLMRDPRWSCVVMTKDWHPRDHISFACNHGLADFSRFQYQSPVKPGETQDATLWPVHCVQNTWGSEVAPELESSFAQLEVDHYVVNKGYLADREYYSGFNDIWNDHRTELADILARHGATDVFVVGLALDYCVKNTAISAAALGYRTTILKDYTRAIATDEHAMAQLRLELVQNDVQLK